RISVTTYGQVRSILSDRDVTINWVWMPPWGPDKITDDGRDQLRMLGFNVRGVSTRAGRGRWTPARFSLVGPARTTLGAEVPTRRRGTAAPASDPGPSTPTHAR